MRDKIEVAGVRDRDLRAILSQYGVDMAIDNGDVLCASCSCVLTWDSIGALKTKKDGVIVFCDLTDCLGAAQEGRSE